MQALFSSCKKASPRLGISLGSGLIRAVINATVGAALLLTITGSAGHDGFFHHFFSSNNRTIPSIMQRSRQTAFPRARARARRHRRRLFLLMPKFHTRLAGAERTSPLSTSTVVTRFERRLRADPGDLISQLSLTWRTFSTTARRPSSKISSIFIIISAILSATTSFLTLYLRHSFALLMGLPRV